MNMVYLVYSRIWRDKDWDLMFVYSTLDKARNYINDSHLEYIKSDNWLYEAEYKIVIKEVE